MTYVLGVDGGNTKTLAAVATLDGTIVGFGKSGCGDIYGAGGEEGAVSHVFEAIQGALATAGLAMDALESAAFSMAGADWPEDTAFWEAAAGARGMRCPVRVVNDAIGGLRSGTLEGYGVSVIVGTGGAVGAISPSGLAWHGGFWAAHAPGSQRMAEAGLKAVCQSELGMLPRTSLTSRLVALLGVEDAEAAVWAVTARRKRQVLPRAAFVTELFGAAVEGDAVAARVIQETGEELGDYALAAARQAGLTGEYPVILAGGVLKNEAQMLVHAIIRRIQAVSSGAYLKMASFEPLAGGVLIAINEAGGEITPETFDRTYESLQRHMRVLHATRRP